MARSEPAYQMSSRSVSRPAIQVRAFGMRSGSVPCTLPCSVHTGTPSHQKVTGWEEQKSSGHGDNSKCYVRAGAALLRKRRPWSERHQLRARLAPGHRYAQWVEMAGTRLSPRVAQLPEERVGSLSRSAGRVPLEREGDEVGQAH